MGRLEAVISDFGGVLTSPLANAFGASLDDSGVPLAELGTAMAALTAQHGVNPLSELETGRVTELEFLGAVAAELTKQMGREITLDGFGERFFANLEPNQTLIAYLRELRGRGYKLAICTNNIREWASRWRAMVPVDELFDVVVDSAFVGTRKPEPEIYELTLRGLGVPAEAAVLIDDLQANCDAARALGLRAVWFQSTEQAIAETAAMLGDGADG
jgi:putative hydrolase of the HAD superfamily